MNNKLSADELKKISGGTKDLNELKAEVLALPDYCPNKNELITEVNFLIDKYRMLTKKSLINGDIMKMEAKIAQEKDKYN